MRSTAASNARQIRLVHGVDRGRHRDHEDVRLLGFARGDQRAVGHDLLHEAIEIRLGDVDRAGGNRLDDVRRWCRRLRPCIPRLAINAAVGKPM